MDRVAKQLKQRNGSKLPIARTSLIETPIGLQLRVHWRGTEVDGCCVVVITPYVEEIAITHSWPVFSSRRYFRAEVNNKHVTVL